MNEQELLQVCNKYLSYNPDTGVITNRISRNSKAMKGQVSGGVNHGGYITITLNKKQLFAHRLAFLIYFGYLPTMLDHKNGDPSDNRISNLRVCTHSENMRNRKTSGESIYRGVSWVKSANKWGAWISIHGNTRNLGLFLNETEAGQAYINAAIKFNVIEYVREV